MSSVWSSKVSSSPVFTSHRPSCSGTRLQRRRKQCQRSRNRVKIEFRSRCVAHGLAVDNFMGMARDGDSLQSILHTGNRPEW